MQKRLADKLAEECTENIEETRLVETLELSWMSHGVMRF